MPPSTILRSPHWRGNRRQASLFVGLYGESAEATQNVWEFTNLTVTCAPNGGNLSVVRDRGYTVVKMKIGGIPLQEDLLRIEAVHAALAPGQQLAVDANGRKCALA